MKLTIKSQSKTSMWTDSSQKEYGLYFTRGKGMYGIKFRSLSRALDPVNFDYRERFLEHAEKLDSSGEMVSKFSILGKLEDITTEDGKIKVRFLLPGALNQTFTVYLDPEKQDIKGKIGLEIQCLMKRIEGIDSKPGVD